MTDWSGLHEDWGVWHEEDGGRVVLVFRPDVFDTQRFPAACLPTVYVSQRSPKERLPRLDAERSEWFVSLRLEPEVQVSEAEGRFESREDAIRAALEITLRFVAGELDLRGAYQVPREEYLDELESLVG